MADALDLAEVADDLRASTLADVSETERTEELTGDDSITAVSRSCICRTAAFAAGVGVTRLSSMTSRLEAGEVAITGVFGLGRFLRLVTACWCL